ncbi:phage portal protein [Streptomyces sp. FH025]|uniref:phage portal protein n=1 Tax=Streptomyces sp. FH025 TaxID=2815937 RepID=UPI001A9EBE4A|nr:phage portal protein [Streptomyces sp. FH025]MBO1414469.1 phage portal protein [Streptomyces sp. FH025]
MSLPVVLQRARHAKGLIDHDAERLNLVDRYARGLHRAPWMPAKANSEFKDLVKRSIVNVSGLAVEAPLNALRVQGFRRPGSGENAYEWRYWQKNRLDERQNAVHRAALTSGAAYVVVTPDPRRGRREPLIRAYDAINTVAVFADPAWDEFPVYALHVPEQQPDKNRTLAFLWDNIARHTVDLDAEPDSAVLASEPHGMNVCPVVRFSPAVDLRGRARGLVEPLIVSQDRLNQQTLSLLLNEHWGAHAIRFATGLAPAERLDPETGDPLRDPETGEPVYDVPSLDPSTLLMAPNSDAKFGQLPAMPTGDLLASRRQTIEELMGLADVPPHYLAGSNLVNLSADALAAAETSFKRFLSTLQDSLGESWESVFRLCAVAAGRGEIEQDESQVEWAEKSTRSLAQAADAMVKLMQQGVPLAVALRKVPGFSQADIDEAVKAAEEAARKAEQAEAEALRQQKEASVGVDSKVRRDSAGGGRVPARAGSAGR